MACRFSRSLGSIDSLVNHRESHKLQYDSVQVKSC